MDPNLRIGLFLHVSFGDFAMLQIAEAAAHAAAQSSNTILTSVCLPGDEPIVAMQSDYIRCHAFSPDGEWFVAADGHGFLYFGHIPLKRQALPAVDPPPRDAVPSAGFPHEFARQVALMHANDYQGPSAMPHLTHFRGYRRWMHLALCNRRRLTFAAIDEEGIVEIWELDGYIWRPQRVGMHQKVHVYSDGSASLAWEPDGSFLHMTDTYDRPYRFVRSRWFRSRWKQVLVKEMR